MLRRILLIVRTIAAVFLLIGVSGSFPNLSADADDNKGQVLPNIGLLEKGNPRLDSHLNQLVAAQNSRNAISEYKPNTEAFNETVRIIVEILPGQTVLALNAAGSFGIIEARHDNLLQMTVPVSLLTALTEIPGISLVRQPQYPQTTAVSQGVSVINADDWQAVGYTGNNIKVGILDIGFGEYALRQSQGDLPLTITTEWAPSIGGPGASTHGTACAEIIYDIAPGAEFYLANFSTEVELANAVDWLIAQGVDIISSSVGWPIGGPGDGTGTICQIVDTARAAGILWFQSVGNQSQRHWNGAFIDANEDGFHDLVNAVTVSSGQSIRIALKWNDTWGVSANDYDLLLLNSSQVPVAVSMNIQDGDDNPREFLSYTATYTGVYYLAIGSGSSPLPAVFNLYSYNQDLHYFVRAGSLVVPADSTNAVAVGAVPWNDPALLESFSSQGPAENGAIKPDLVAPDGVTNASINPFYGSSASTPHAAGAAVLVKYRYPSYTSLQIQSFLEGRAVDLGDSGKDNIFGSGLLDLGIPEGPLMMNPITEIQGRYYNYAPVFSVLGFTDEAGLDGGWYQMDSFTGNWTALFENAPGTTWSSDNWTIPRFDDLGEGSHIIYFKASDDVGYVFGESGEWPWQFFKDTIPPGMVTDLSAGNPAENSVILTWTAPGNNGSQGAVSQYDIRYIEGESLTDGNWDTAAQIDGEPVPGTVGSSENFTLHGLQPEKTYYFAIKAVDEALNWSEISNSPGETTLSHSLTHAFSSLSPGWNTLSTPMKLHTTIDTWGELAAANNLNFNTAYWWNGTSFVWVDAAQSIVPLDAIYVNMNAVGTVTFTPFDGVSSPPSRALVAGWNLVGSAFETPTMPVNEALISIYFAPGNLWGYSMAVSSGAGQTPWTYIRDGVSPPNMEIGKGYWVFMTNPATLAGFTSTP